MTSEVRVHGTAIVVDGRAALFQGAPGSGKSDLALRLIERGAALVGDDQVWLGPGTPPSVRPDPRIAGKLEVRGIGILDVAHQPQAPLWAVFNLCKPEEVPRLPEEDWAQFGAEICARRFPLAPFEASAPDKVRLTLEATARMGKANPGKD